MLLAYHGTDYVNKTLINPSRILDPTYLISRRRHQINFGRIKARKTTNWGQLP